MALLSLVVLPAKVKKGGKHNVRIAVAHNSQTRYIVTDVIIDSIKQWRHGQVVNRPDANILNMRLRQKLAEYEKVLGEQYYLDGLTCSQLVTLLKNGHENENMTIGGAFDAMLQVADISRGSEFYYATVKRSAVNFFGKNKLLRTITNSDVLLYQKHLLKKGLSTVTVRNRVVSLGTVYRFGKRNGYVRSDILDPFNGIRLPPIVVHDDWLSLENVRKVRDYIPNAPFVTQHMQKAIDIFMLSYYLGGINICDILRTDFREMQHTFSYTRKKVEKRWGRKEDMLTFDMPAEAWRIIEKYLKPNGHLKLCASTRNSITKHLATIAQELGIEKFTMKAARKSFAQHAFDLGISDRIIDRVLGHIPAQRGSVMHHYIMVTDAMVNDCIRRVIDNLNADKKDSYSFAAIGASSNI